MKRMLTHLLSRKALLGSALIFPVVCINFASSIGQSSTSPRWIKYCSPLKSKYEI